MKKCLVISNPYSGSSNKKDNINSYIEKLTTYGYDPIFIKTEYKNHAYEIAKNVENVDLIISDGGDGTLHEVVSGNLAREKQLLHAHIPTGTTNDVGKMYGYSNDPLTCLDEVMNGEEKDVDFFKINNEPFVYVTGIGQFLHIPYTTQKEAKDKYGHLAYLKDGVKAALEGTKSYNFKYEIDGHTFDGKGSIILMSNSTRIAGFSGFFNDDYVKLDDGLFEFVVIKADKFSSLAAGCAKMLLTDITKVNQADVIKTDNLKITFNEKLLHNPCIDGEEFKEDKYDVNNPTFEVNLDKKVKMLVPTRNINKLFKKTLL